MERHAHLLLRSLVGRRVMLIKYDRLLADPEEWRLGLLEFCGAAGLPTRKPLDLAVNLLPPSVKNSRGRLNLHQEQLASWFDGLEGSHDHFPTVDLPQESPECAALLSNLRLPSWFAQPTGVGH